MAADLWWEQCLLTIFQMCPILHEESLIKAYYVSDDIYEINLPETLENLPQLGDIEDTDILGYIIIANGEEITIITNEEEYLSWHYELHN